MQRLYDANHALTRERDELRAEVERLRLLLDPDAVDDFAALQAEVERLQRENGALARMYALCEETLRERTEQVNRADDEVATWHRIWNDAAILALRVDALRDGTADLGKPNCC